MGDSWSFARCRGLEDFVGLDLGLTPQALCRRPLSRAKDQIRNHDLRAAWSTLHLSHPRTHNSHGVSVHRRESLL